VAVLVIINGEERDDILLYDDGLNYGYGLFETILVRSKPVFLYEHCNRLRAGLDLLRIKNTVDERYILNCVENNKINNCILKVILTERNIVISTRPVTYKPEKYLIGYNIKISKVRRNPYSHTVYIKSLNYTDNKIEKEIASSEGFDEVLFLNTRNEVSECSVANIFFLKDGVIKTPALRCGILDGIVRRWVIDNYHVVEGIYYLEDILTADEVFLTNSVLGLMKVRSLNSTVFGQESIYNAIQENYKKYLSTF
jgi:4-amino-4-deoxychorismate lyase